MAKGYPDYEGDKSGLYLIPEWAAKEATDKTFHSGDTNQATLAEVQINYDVPAAKTLYVCYFAVTATGYAAADRDLNQMVWGFVRYTSPTVTLVRIAGNGGASIAFNKPLVIPGGKQAQFRVKNLANHNADIYISVGGYEL